MLRIVVTSAARATASVAHGMQQQTYVATTLARHFSASRVAFDGGMSQKAQDGCYSRIAAKLGKTNYAMSMAAIDRTIAFLQQVGLSKSSALMAVAKHPMVRSCHALRVAVVIAILLGCLLTPYLTLYACYAADGFVLGDNHGSKGEPLYLR